jgi:hypothetical protein
LASRRTTRRELNFQITMSMSMYVYMNEPILLINSYRKKSVQSNWNFLHYMYRFSCSSFVIWENSVLIEVRLHQIILYSKNREMAPLNALKKKKKKHEKSRKKSLISRWLKKEFINNNNFSVCMNVVFFFVFSSNLPYIISLSLFIIVFTKKEDWKKFSKVANIHLSSASASASYIYKPQHVYVLNIQDEMWMKMMM